MKHSSWEILMRKKRWEAGSVHNVEEKVPVFRRRGSSARAHLRTSCSCERECNLMRRAEIGWFCFQVHICLSRCAFVLSRCLCKSSENVVQLFISLCSYLLLCWFVFWSGNDMKIRFILDVSLWIVKCENPALPFSSKDKISIFNLYVFLVTRPNIFTSLCLCSTSIDLLVGKSLVFITVTGTCTCLWTDKEEPIVTYSTFLLCFRQLLTQIISVQEATDQCFYVSAYGCS